jgi:hypothetical protein
MPCNSAMAGCVATHRGGKIAERVVGSCLGGDWRRQARAEIADVVSSVAQSARNFQARHEALAAGRCSGAKVMHGSLSLTDRT